ncbi:MAG: ABC transporter permease [Anaerolineae bacterium]|nr:ABC transporter permease [Anaerolineae bacterium]
MLTKLLAIARKDIFTTFQDRQAVLILIAVPLALSTIIGLSFGSEGDVSIDAVPLAVVDQDAGTTIPQTGQPTHLGQTYRQAFVPSGNAAAARDFAVIHDLIDGELSGDWDGARQQVEDGDLAAAIRVPETFSADIFGAAGGSAVEVYYDSGLMVGPSVVISITRAITNGMNAVILAQRAGPDIVAQLGAELGQDAGAIQAAAGQVIAESESLGGALPVQMQQVDMQGEIREVDALKYYAPSMAILFMTFAMATGATGILDEQRRWTLQRIISTPTPRWIFLGGKLAGTYLTGIIQMVLLIITTSLVALVMGREGAVWGSNITGIALLVLAVVFAGTALGLLIAAISQTPEQASTYSTVILFLMGMIGGSFVDVSESFPAWLPRLTLNHWGIQGFMDLSQNDAPLGDIVPNLLALGVMGLVLFGISLWRFNRRLDL